jgi:hypothetical protein
VSHLALRRVVIRLLHDPVFAAALATDPEHALAGVDLTATERAWVTAPPPAAWRTDPARPARVLAALAEEYPATMAVAASYGGGFFQSPEFHTAVQERGSLALAFGDYLVRAPIAAARVLAPLERAVAVVRRAAASAADGAVVRVRLSPRARVFYVPAGALDLLAAIRAGHAPGAWGPEEEPVLVVAPLAGEVTLESLEPALAALLLRAAEGVSRAALADEARRHGAAPGEDAEIIDRLLADGLLVGADDLRV